MEFKRKIAVITGGGCRAGLFLAKRLTDEGARVIISDSNETILKNISNQTGATMVVANCRERSALMLLIDKALSMFGRIDFFIFNTATEHAGESFISESERSMCLHLQAMNQMYAIRHVLPHMIGRAHGHIINIIFGDDLMHEFHSPVYSTIKHPALSLSERLALTYRNAGIKVSLICVSRMKELKLTACGLSKIVMHAIQRDHFLISSQDRIYRHYQKTRRTFRIISRKRVSEAA